jgi:hypothetical protein
LRGRGKCLRRGSAASALRKGIRDLGLLDFRGAERAEPGGRDRNAALQGRVTNSRHTTDTDRGLVKSLSFVAEMLTGADAQLWRSVQTRPREDAMHPHLMAAIAEARDRELSRKRRRTDGHRFSTPIVRENPRPMPSEPLGDASW